MYDSLNGFFITAIIAQLNWGSVPDWLAAIGTIGAVIVALFFAGRDGRERSNRERRRQAEGLTTWRRFDRLGNITSVVMINNSTGTLFDIAVSVGVARGAGEAFRTGNENNVFLTGLPPGEYEINPPPQDDESMHKTLGVSVTFRDSRGVYWRRDATGELYETTPQEPYAGLGITLPVKSSGFRVFAKK